MEESGKRGGWSEQEVIRRVTERLPAAPGATVGIGDDAALVRLDGQQVITTDLLIEGVHFDLRYMSLADVGYKALMVNLSDINAMGGRSMLALGQLGVPRGATVADVDLLLDGVDAALRYAAEAGQTVSLVGGDTVNAPQWVVGFTVIGQPAHSTGLEHTLLRSGARPGDRLYHTGRLGRATAGLYSLHGELNGYAPAIPQLAAALRRPRPPLTFGPWLAERGKATAAQDLSDSLSQVACQLAAASGVGLQLDFSGYFNSVAIDLSFAEFAADLRRADGSFVVPAEMNPAGMELRYPSAAALLLSCAEDYELLFTMPARADPQWLEQSQEWCLGEVVPAAEGLSYRDEHGESHALAPAGYAHLG